MMEAKDYSELVQGTIKGVFRWNTFETGCRED